MESLSFGSTFKHPSTISLISSTVDLGRRLYSRLKTFCFNFSKDIAQKGTFPVTNSYKMTPSDQTSAEKVYLFPSSTSGAIVIRVPHPVLVSLLKVSKHFDKPRSAILIS